MSLSFKSFLRTFSFSSSSASPLPPPPPLQNKTEEMLAPAQSLKLEECVSQKTCVVDPFSLHPDSEFKVNPDPVQGVDDQKWNKKLRPS